MKKKISTAERAETAEYCLRTKNENPSVNISSSPALPEFCGLGVLSSLGGIKIFVSSMPPRRKKRG
jgi:hypothetical protein